MAIGPVYTAVMDKAITIMMDVLRPILNRDVEINIGELGEADIEMLTRTFDDDFVMVQAPVSGAVTADQYFFFSKRLAAAITDLMVMGDGTAEFSEHESLDGVAEAVNQIVGAQATQWGDELKTDINPDGAQANVIGVDTLDFDESLFYGASLSVAIDEWGDDTLIYFTGKDLFETLKSLIDPASMKKGADAGEGAAGSGATAGAAGGGRSTAGGEEKAVQRAEFGEFDVAAAAGTNGDGPRNLDLLMDISLPVTIELGRTEMLIRDVLELGPGSVIELQKLSGEPVDLYINDKQFALGEVVVIDENFGIRITELLSVEDRIKALR